MYKTRTWRPGTLLLAVLLIVPLTSQAMLISRLGGQAYYDTVLDITWLADANLAASNTFGVGGINASGTMNWTTANVWIASMNGANHLGFSDWRLPMLSPVSGGAAFGTAAFSNNGTTDGGYGETGIGWDTGAGAIVSEMGWMYYGNLGNLGFCTPNDIDPGSCALQTGFGLANTGPFSNLQSNLYRSGVEFDASDAWGFNFANGFQFRGLNSVGLFVWAVRSGDVDSAAPVPEPGTMVLLSVGLLGLAGGRWQMWRAGASVLRSGPENLDTAISEVLVAVQAANGRTT